MKVSSIRSTIMLLLLCCAVVVTGALMGGCAGDDGAAGAAGAAGTPGTPGTNLTATAKPESCAICHGDAASAHQSQYNDYVDTTLAATIDSVTSVASGTYFNTTVQFTIKKNGMPYVPVKSYNFKSEFDQTTVYAVMYSSGTRTFGSPVSFPTASFTTTGNGIYTAPATTLTYAPESANALVYMYVAKGKLATEGMQLYSDVANAGKAYGDVASYVSTANVSGCEKCHGAPYRKHGYRAAAVSNLSDFAACKVCHYDSRTGGHSSWQLLVDDPARYAELNAIAKSALASGNTASNSVDKNMTTAEKAKYPYKANVMNDTHMSHAMEFAYPQEMANCATCHAGKLGSILTDANFNLTTCRSCHPVTAAAGTDSKRAPSLISLMTNTSLGYTHGAQITAGLYADAATPPTCTGCHDGVSAPAFSTIHTGYNSMISTATGTKYADAITASIDSATLTGNVLDIKFSVADSLATGFTVTPSVYVSLYGYDTKDFILSCHTSDTNGKRMEKTIGTANTLFTEVATGVPGAWEVTLDLSSYAATTSIPAMIANGTVKRMEIAVLPAMKNTAGVTLGLNAPSKTFDVATNAFVTYYAPIVDANKCNKCHDQLATTFHSGNRGGNVVVCRMCHVPTSGGSHLEMQSRSIDSYVHAIHSFQPFDVGRALSSGGIDFTDPVEALHYEHHIESTYPNFTITNCESCHNAGTYGVPDQSKSLPGKHSAANNTLTNGGWDRNIGAVPAYVTGPASRACGGCHRAEFINEDNAAGLAAFNQHTATNGYLLEDAPGLLDTVIDTIMSIFK
jgi:OmcA/MtrC family decaheme c-type cytochrome